MSDGISFNIYIPSYRRAKAAKTHAILEYYTYVVRASEADEYVSAGIPEDRIWAVEDSEIDSIVKVVNYIVDNSPEDCIAMIDDDMDHLVYRLDRSRYITDPETATAEIERIAQIMCDLGIGYGAVDSSKAPWGYDGPFSFKGTSGGLRWFNKAAYKSRFDEEIGYCCDIDCVMHELLVNRVILKPKYLCSDGGTDTNEGGNSDKNRGDQIASINLMKHRWGRYFSYDLKKNVPRVMVPR